MEEAQQKKVSKLNEFREMFYNYNQEEREQLSNFYDAQEENNQFSHNYKKVQKEKNKFSTGTYLDHQYLVPIASRYAVRGIKVPKISVDKNVFSANPLILGGSDLEKFFLYNLGDKKKSGLFLNKVDNIVRRKETGNYILSDEEMRKLEFLQKKEKPKGYIPPKTLIPKLKNEIKQTKFACENLENFEKFFENIDKKDNSEIKIKTKLILDNRHSQSSNNIFRNMVKIKNNILNNKIKVDRNIIKKIRLNNNLFSNSSTKAYGGSKRFTSSNSQCILNYRDISKSNPSSAFSREKPNNLKNSPILSPFSRSNNNSKLYNNLYNGITKKDNNSSDFFILSKPFDYPEKDAYNILYDKIEKKNISQKSSKNNLFSYRKSSALSIISKDSKNEKSENISKRDKEQESEDIELKLLNNELEEKEDNKSNNIKIQTENSNSNLENNKIEKSNDITNKEENIIKNNNQQFIRPLKKIKIVENISKNISEIEPKTIKHYDNYDKIEKIFNSILGNDYSSRRSRSVIKNFLKERGFNTTKKYESKDAYININRMKTKAIERNFLLEEFRIRNGEFSKTPLSNKQQAIIDKNELYAQEIERNEYILKKLLCEKNIEKENIDY